MSNPKGIIIGYTVESAVEEGGFTFSMSSRLDSTILKKHLLYWDAITYPIVNGFGPNFDRNPELEFLNSQGVLSTDEIIINPADVDPGYSEENGIHIPDLLAYGQLELTKKYLNKGEVWSIAQVGGTFNFSSGNEKNKSMLELSLSNGLPVPDDQTSFDDIINFRISHTNELNNLRTVLEKLRNQVISSEEHDRTLVLVKEELSESINNISSAMDKHNLVHFFDTLSVYSQINLAAFEVGKAIVPHSGLPFDVGVTTGMGTATILSAFIREVRGAVTIPEELSDFMYLYTAKKHGIVS